MAISSQLIVDINENDAKAAVRTWGQTLAQQAETAVDSNVQIISGADAFVRAFSDKDVDSATVTTAEFLALENRALVATNLVAEGGDGAGDTYVLLVHE